MNNIQDNSLIINNIKILNAKSKEITYAHNPEYLISQTNGLSNLKNKLCDSSILLLN